MIVVFAIVLVTLGMAPSILASTIAPMAIEAMTIMTVATRFPSALVQFLNLRQALSAVIFVLVDRLLMFKALQSPRKIYNKNVVLRKNNRKNP